MWERFKPCCFCTAEVGVYLFSLTHSLFLTGAVVLGVILFHTTYLFFGLSPDEMPIYEKALHVVYLTLYVIFFLIEIVLREYLYKTLDMTRECKLRRCQNWVRWKLILVVLYGHPAVLLHLYLDLTPFKIVMYSLATIYEYYYIWVVHHFTLEVKMELTHLNTLVEKESTPHVKIEAHPV